MNQFSLNCELGIMVFHDYTGHLFLGSRKLFFNYIDMKAFNLALNPYIIPLQAFSYSFNVRYTCRFFPGWVVNSPFLMATRRSFLSSVISAPGYKCPPWTSGVRIPPKGCGMCLRFCLFTSCMTPTLIGWIWPKFRGGGWNNLFIACQVDEVWGQWVKIQGTVSNSNLWASSYNSFH